MLLACMLDSKLEKSHHKDYLNLVSNHPATQARQSVSKGFSCGLKKLEGMGQAVKYHHQNFSDEAKDGQEKPVEKAHSVRSLMLYYVEGRQSCKKRLCH